MQRSMAALGKPEDNGYAERLMRTLKEEEVDLSGTFWTRSTPASAFTPRWAISLLLNLRQSDWLNTRNPC
jgi:transposase InsO family protein